ncbi:hypothetical protein FRC12_007254, partial [Ceratobasidium sp. 428]
MSTFSKITYHISAILALALDGTVFPFVAKPPPLKVYKERMLFPLLQPVLRVKVLLSTMSVTILAASPLPHNPHSSHLIPPLSSLSSCASGVYSIKLVDLLLTAHPRVTEREVEFTILVLDTVVHM